MDDLDFTEEEIREQLEKLGYYDVPTSRLAEFKRDLEKLVTHERSKNGSWSTCSETASSVESQDVQRNPFDEAGNRHKYTHGPKTDYSRYGKENMIYDNAGYHSVVTKARVAMPTTMHNASLYSTESEAANDSEMHDDTVETTSERKMIKRRVLRKRDGHAEITDELTESEADDVSCLGDRLDDLRLGKDPLRRSMSAPPSNHPNHFDPYQHLHARERPKSAQRDDQGPARFGLPENYDGPTSLIKPMSEDPHTRHIRKNDPVARFQKYRQSWQCQHAPGEKSHKGLRWNVREQMLYHDQVLQKRAHKVYVPNSYVIPSDKKRKSLRWQVRQDLAQGVIPPSAYDGPPPP